MVEVDLADYDKWDAKTKAALAARLQERIEKPAQVWFCKRGRACDGLPHDGVPYNHARQDQWPPNDLDWFIWLILSGRGAGKTRTGAEFFRKMSRKHSRMAGIGRRTTDIRSTLVEGDSGLIKVCERAGEEHLWEPSKREFTFSNGAKVHFYSAEEPDSLRGPQHELAWLDEPAHMPLIQDVWDNLLLGLRIGPKPRILITSTPLPIPWLKELVKREDTRVVRVSTYANLANLAESYRQAVIDRYEGTRLGRQELHGEIIEDVEGALWNGELIDAAKKGLWDGSTDLTGHDWPFERIVVGVDPAGTANPKSDATGIVVCGVLEGLYYVLADYTGVYTPDQWAKKVMRAYKEWHADRIVVEKNYGGDMVTAVLRNEDEHAPITEVTSRKGKVLRAEPIVGLYEQSKVKHLQGLSELETEQVEWVPGRSPSPNRIDAMVHAMTNLVGKGGPAQIASARNITMGAPMSGTPRPQFGTSLPPNFYIPGR